MKSMHSVMLVYVDGSAEHFVALRNHLLHPGWRHAVRMFGSSLRHAYSADDQLRVQMQCLVVRRPRMIAVCWDGDALDAHLLARFLVCLPADFSHRVSLFAPRSHPELPYPRLVLESAVDQLATMVEMPVA